MENKVEFYPVLRKLVTYKLYVHVCKIPNNNGIYKKYFGITCQTIKSRWGNNGDGYKCKDKNNEYIYFYKAILKHGWDNFEHIVLHEYLSKWEAEDLEKKFIAYYKTDDKKYGYNCTKGGEGGIPNEETCNKISKALSGKNNYWYNKTIPSDIRQKMCENHADISGENHPLFNTHRTQKTKNKIMQSQNCSIIICNETKKVYKSIREASRITGLSRSSIRRCCEKQQKNVHGYTFSYICRSTVDTSNIFVVCLDSCNVYCSLRNAESKTGVGATNISRCCKSKYLIHTANKLHWMFLDDVIKNIILLTNPDLYVKMLL